MMITLAVNGCVIRSIFSALVALKIEPLTRVDHLSRRRAHSDRGGLSASLLVVLSRGSFPRISRCSFNNPRPTPIANLRFGDGLKQTDGQRKTHPEQASHHRLPAVVGATLEHYGHACGSLVVGRCSLRARLVCGRQRSIRGTQCRVNPASHHWVQFQPLFWTAVPCPGPASFFPNAGSIRSSIPCVYWVHCSCHQPDNNNTSVGTRRVAFLPSVTSRGCTSEAEDCHHHQPLGDARHRL